MVQLGLLSTWPPTSLGTWDDGCRALWRFDRSDVGVRESAGLGDDVIVAAGLADRL